jgi:hypothetical protein
VLNGSLSVWKPLLSGKLQDPPHYLSENRYYRRAFMSAFMRDIADEEVALFTLRTNCCTCYFVE